MTDGTVVRRFFHFMTLYAVLMCGSILVFGKLAGGGSMTGGATDFSLRKMRFMIESDA
jgi:hypothetical protein